MITLVHLGGGESVVVPEPHESLGTFDAKYPQVMELKVRNIDQTLTSWA